MTGILNTRILASLAMIVFVGAIAASGTGAFFSDTETSTGNTFTAGSLDLKVDSEAHYNGSICLPNLATQQILDDYTWQDGNIYPVGLPCEGTWAETDLGITHKFFNLLDVKPGDEGENTISLHVYDNDAYGRFLINNVEDLDNTCTEPETESSDTDCNSETPTPGVGELADSITFYGWLDQGAIPGFQGSSTPTELASGGEGDNLWQCAQFENSIANYISAPAQINPANCAEPLVILPGTVDDDGGAETPDETHNIWSALEAVWLGYCDDQDATGHNSYGLCHGIAEDGRMVGSTTYYFGLAWNVPTTVGNEAQTDSLNADLSFEVEQHRNNPNPFSVI